ncbi:hypothetical protein [Tunturiibacter gelidoferens]|uniref:Uncharacterized protein n=1 Tax=Tunturiibacter lichenicola TaxID=2051959 RepID=A0A7Y9NKW6_9BACT|nr:hypothetical protein [Edaphobacter lichenicola]NYF51276.1 hypothetical protein [Edaphobacter lichenicola]
MSLAVILNVVKDPNTFHLPIPFEPSSPNTPAVAFFANPKVST